MWLLGTAGACTKQKETQILHKIKSKKHFNQSRSITLFLHPRHVPPPPPPPQGLFRLAAAASVVKRLKTCLDQEAVDHSEFSMDPHAVAGEDASTSFFFLFLSSSWSLALAFCRVDTRLFGQHDFRSSF